jgi:hypothetical protein
MAERTIADLRRDYFHATDASTLEDWPRWNAKTFRNQQGDFVVAPGPVTLGGVLLIRGSNDALVLLYNAPGVVGLSDTQLIAAAGATGSQYAMDGFVNCPILAQNGLVISINVSDAIVTVLYL